MIVSLLLNSLALGSLLVMLASGLALMYGLRNVMNFGHGALYMLGAYVGYSLSSHLGFWPALLLTPLVLAAGGPLFEYLIVRRFHHRSHMELAMVTYGAGLIIGQAILSTYGGEPRAMSAPPGLEGSVSVAGTLYPAFRLFLVGMGFATCCLLAAWLRWTRTGLYVRAVSQDASVAEMMGVNSDRLSLAIVCFSTGFAGLAGVLAGPYVSIDPGMGPASIVTCLIIVVVGGVGSIAGAIFTAILYGFVEVFGSVLLPSISTLLPYVLLIGVLLWRPQGLAGRRRA